jgi:endonuclease YncB( thermonuclease family)
MALPVVLVVPAIVTGIVDGDTLKVRAFPWTPGWTIETNVRVNGIDTPEVDWHAGCAGEALLGDAARRFVTVEFLGQQVALVAVKPDKYGDRVVATVVRGADKADWASMLLAEGLARPYTGSGPKPAWCL